MKITSNPRGLAHTTIATTLLLVYGSQARAVEFATEGGWSGTVNTTLSAGDSWRTEDPSSKLYSAADGNRIGVTGGTGGSRTDAADLNWGKGDTISTPLQALVDLSMHDGDVGLFVRGKAWTDLALKTDNVRGGNADNGYATNAPLSDASQPALNKFSGVALLDAYVYDSFDAGGRPLQVRAGKQVVNWGESLFVQGVNQLNPVDLPALHRPGTEIKEALLPVWSLLGNLGLGDGASLEAFYQLKWDSTLVDSCGGYWSPVEFGISTSAGGGCQGAATTAGAGSNATNIANGAYIPLATGKDGADSGQFGFALHLPLDAIDSELGLYAMQFNSRTPIISGYSGSWGAYAGPARTTLNPLAIHQTLLGAAGVQSMSVFWEYPNAINVFGASLAANISGWSVAGELSYTPNQPVQINGNDLLNAMVAGVGPMGPTAITAAANGAGTYVSGYDRIAKTQLQLNTIKVLPGMAGASQGLFVGEVAGQWNNVPDPASGRRYGRSFIFGMASVPGINTCVAALSGALYNPQTDGCQNDGFVSPFAWGYRLKGQLDYPGAFGSAFTLTPNVFWSQDVSGYSSDTQLLQGRTTLAIGVKADYQKKYTLDLTYTTYGSDARFDQFRDRDYVSVSISSTF